MFAHPGVRGLTARKERSSPESFVLMSYLPLHGMTSLRSGDLPFNSFPSEIRINFLLTRKSYQMNGFAIGITREPHCFWVGIASSPFWGVRSRSPCCRVVRERVLGRCT